MKKIYIVPSIDELYINHAFLETSVIDVNGDEHDDDAGQYSKSRFSFGDSDESPSDPDSFDF